MNLEAALNHALGVWGHGLLCYIAYRVARHSASKASAAWRSYGTATAVVAVLAAIAASSAGTHVEDADPLRGGGEVVEDYPVSPAERTERGVADFLTLLGPALLGVRAGRRDPEPAPVSILPPASTL